MKRLSYIEDADLALEFQAKVHVLKLLLRKIDEGNIWSHSRKCGYVIEGEPIRHFSSGINLTYDSTKMSVVRAVQLIDRYNHYADRLVELLEQADDAYSDKC